MAEVTTAFGTGAIMIGALAMAGIDVPSLGAALAACVAVQTILPSEKTSRREIVLLTVGSMILASLATPWFLPWVSSWAPRGIGDAHLKASVAAVLAAFPKPILLAGRAVLRKILKTSTGVTDADVA